MEMYIVNNLITRNLKNGTRFSISHNRNTQKSIILFVELNFYNTCEFTSFRGNNK